jgi:branched-chain amino acid aminotransferase
VIKVVEGVPLFFEEHMERMKRSADLLGVRIQKAEKEILEEISMLVQNNRCQNINVKLVWAQMGEESVFLTYFIRSEYPGQEAYTQGIHTILFHGERINPHIKTLSGSFRERVKDARERSGAYEALLVSKEGYITEGTRSNIFFLKEGRIYTPPAKSVLLGVTRKHVLQICETLEIEVKEETLHVEELPKIEGAFITGTTVDVLPIGSIDDRKIHSVSNPFIQNIVKQYNEEMREYIEQSEEQRCGERL